MTNPKKQKLIISCDVIFKENEFLPLSAFSTISNSQTPFETPFDNDILDDDILNDEDKDLNNFVTPKHPAPPQFLPSESLPHPLLSTSTTSLAASTILFPSSSSFSFVVVFVTWTLHRTLGVSRGS